MNKLERKWVAVTVEAFAEYCELEGVPMDCHHLLLFLLKNNLLSQYEMKKLVVKKTVEEISFCNQISKTKAIQLFENEYGISERAIFNMLKK